MMTTTRHATGWAKPSKPESTKTYARLDTVIAQPWAAFLAVALALPACRSRQVPSTVPELDIPVLQHVQNWTMQLQGLDDPQAVHQLEKASVDMVVIEPMRSQRGQSDFATQALVARLQKSPGATLPNKRCLAYFNIGQAEDYRKYWRSDWQAPTADRRGSPSFLVGLDPDGWQGNYPVAFWDPAWRRCLYGTPDSLLDQILDDGFEGVYLDWVLGFDDPQVVATAKAAGVDPAAEMVRLLTDLRTYARARQPLFVMIAQNGVALCERNPDVMQVIDALSQEDVSFRGMAGVDWQASDAGDIAAPATGEWSTARLCERLAVARNHGLSVFTLDYALREHNVDLAVANSRAHGFVPCVTRTPLDRLATPIPPPNSVLAAPR